MTRFILRLCLPYVVITALVSGVTLAYAVYVMPRTTEHALPGFDACQLPCWAGLVPGETAFGEAVTQLQTHLPPTHTWVGQNGSMVSFSTAIEDTFFSGVAYYNRGKVGRVSTNALLSVGYLLDTLGAPDCVVLFQQMDVPSQLILYWQRDQWFVRTMLVASESGHLNASGVAQGFAIGLDKGICNEQSQSWLGFAPVWRYAAQ
jgi:hypothetical protein